MSYISFSRKKKVKINYSRYSAHFDSSSWNIIGEIEMSTQANMKNVEASGRERGKSRKVERRGRQGERKMRIRKERGQGEGQKRLEEEPWRFRVWTKEEWNICICSRVVPFQMLPSLSFASLARRVICLSIAILFLWARDFPLLFLY